MPIEGLGEALSYYRICVEAEGYSRKTIVANTMAVRFLSDFLSEHVNLSDVTIGHLRAFILALRRAKAYRSHPYTNVQDRPLSPHTVATYVRSIKAVFAFLAREEMIPQNPFANFKEPKAPRKVVPTFSEKEMERILSQPDKKTPTGFRDYVIILALYDTAVRRSELANLRLDGVDFELGELRIMGKGGKENYVPMGRNLTKAMLKYKIKYRPQSDSDAFFLSHDGRPLSSERLHRIVKKYSKMAGLSRCYPHKLRHTGAVAFVRNGGDPFTLQKKLNHSTLVMTRHYCELGRADVRRAQLKFSPGDRLKV